MNLQTRLITESVPYLGPELRPHFLLSHWAIRGSALVAFRGPCEVQTEHMVDWEDRLNQDSIRAKEMLHFLGEFFGLSLKEGVLLQRLFVAQIKERLGERVRRSGDDLFVDEKKLTVSIVTASPVSQLLHLGINIDPEGAPVEAIGLKELGVEPNEFASQILEHFQQEWSSIEWACTKVRPVL